MWESLGRNLSLPYSIRALFLKCSEVKALLFFFSTHSSDAMANFVPSNEGYG